MEHILVKLQFYYLLVFFSALQWRKEFVQLQVVMQDRIRVREGGVKKKQACVRNKEGVRRPRDEETYDAIERQIRNVTVQDALELIEYKGVSASFDGKKWVQGGEVMFRYGKCRVRDTYVELAEAIVVQEELQFRPYEKVAQFVCRRNASKDWKKGVKRLVCIESEVKVVPGEWENCKSRRKKEVCDMDDCWCHVCSGVDVSHDNRIVPCERYVDCGNSSHVKCSTIEVGNEWFCPECMNQM